MSAPPSSIATPTAPHNSAMHSHLPNRGSSADTKITGAHRGPARDLHRAARLIVQLSCTQSRLGHVLTQKVRVDRPFKLFTEGTQAVFRPLPRYGWATVRGNS